jgi:hypothetical protein
MTMRVHHIILEPAGYSRFTARLPSGEILVTGTLTPFFAAARALIARGANPADVLIARHKGSDTIALKAKVGAAAKLAVRDTDLGPRFIPWADPTDMDKSTAGERAAAEVPDRTPRRRRIPARRPGRAAGPSGQGVAETDPVT